MSYRLAESLKQLRTQINEAWPQRDTESDGWIGDANHASRKSDHNPWVKDHFGQGVVTAIDLDEDLKPDNGQTMRQVIDSIAASKDQRVKYIIYEGKITEKGSNLQRWKPYKGPNAHRHHAHISVYPDPKLYDNTDRWKIISDGVVAIPTNDPEFRYVVVPGDSLWGISRRFSTSVEQLMQWNNLESTLIKVGQNLKVR